MNEAGLKDVFRVIENTNGIFLAFNSNIDVIKHVDKSMEKYAKNPQPRLVKLKNPRDLFSGILYSMKNGESAELTMNSSLEKWLSKNILPERRRMGGQAGIMANILAILGTQPIVYTPLLSKDQRKMFSKKVLLVDRGLKHPSRVKRNDNKKTNWIFEFHKGQKFFDVTAKDTTRFIAASRPEKFRLKNIKLDFNFSCAVLSGFQCILEKYKDGHTYMDQFHIAKNLAKQIKARRKPIHIEMAFIKSKKIMSKTLEVASGVDSIGLDESELMQILEFFGERKLAKKIRTKHDITDIFIGIKKMYQKIAVKKIHLHGRGYFLSICKDYHTKPENVRKSMEFSSVVAAAQASNIIKTKSDVRGGLKFPVSKIGKEAGKKLTSYLRSKKIVTKNGICHDGEHYIIFVPTPLVRRARDIVGLGDMISASIFVAETGYTLAE